MADEPNKPGSWWTTVPGILTATAAVITAVTGLLAILSQNGVLGEKNRNLLVTQSSAARDEIKPASPASSLSDAVAPGRSASRETAQAANPPVSMPARSEKSADKSATSAGAQAPPLQSIPYRAVRVVLRDGAVISLRDDFRVGPAQRLELKSGQAIDFARIVSIEVLDVSDVYQPATARIKLNNGVLLDEKFDPYWGLTGHNELGEFATRWPQVKSVEFVR